MPIHYPETLTIVPLDHVPDVALTVPGSKSITNRALILAALAEGVSTLHGALAAEDTEVMIEALRILGFSIAVDSGAETVTVQGQGGRIPASSADIFVGNSGTSMRFLTALVALGKGPYRLDGVSRMRERPQADLLEALETLGVSAISEAGTGCPPLIVMAENGLSGGSVSLRADASSQFLTALLMVAPYAQSDLRLEIVGSLRPLYINMTRWMMVQWGVLTKSGTGTAMQAGAAAKARIDAEENTQVETEGSWFHVGSGQKYRAQSAYMIEPDASSASYFFAAAALTGGKVTVRGLDADALQGDVRFAKEALAEMGCTVAESDIGLTVAGPKPGALRGIERDMRSISDTAPTLAAIAPFANSPTVLHGLAHTRHQECDRIAAVCTELRKLGVGVEERADGYTIYPHPDLALQAKTMSSVDTSTFGTVEIETYDDHRIAMSFALIGLVRSGVTIQNPGCVAKTFPDYWQRLDLLRS